MAQNNTTIPTKSTGQTLTAAEFNELDDAVNNNATDAESRIASLEGAGGDLTLTDKTADANITAVAGEMHVVEMNSGTPFTASRNWTLPVAASVSTGDQFGLMIKDGDGAFEVNVRTGAAGDLLNGVDVSAASNEWELFQTGEVLIVTCIDGATGDYIVEHDGRIPCTARIHRDDTAGAQVIPDATLTKVEFTENNFNRGLTVDTTTNYSITTRRGGIYNVQATILTNDAAINSGENFLCSVYYEGTRINTGGAAKSIVQYVDASVNDSLEMLAGEKVEAYCFHGAGVDVDLAALAVIPNYLILTEIL